jgi:ferredoxin
MIETPSKIITISSSKIESSDCPYYFFKEYLEGERREDGPDTSLNLLVGRFCHQVIDLYTKSLMRLKLVADVSLFNQILEAAWEQETLLPNSYHDEIWDMLTAFVETYTIDLNCTWASEKDMAFRWDLTPCGWKDEDAWLRAKLDRVDIYAAENTAVVIDYKTSAYVPNEAKLRKSLQTVIYPYTIFLANPYLERIIVRFWYVRWNKKVDITFVMRDPQEGEILLQPDKIEKRLKDFTSRIMKRIEDTETKWIPIRCSRCGICRYECPLIAEGIVPIKTVDQARDVAMQIEALSVKQSDLKKMLQDYVKGTDTKVDIHSGYYEYRMLTVLRGMKASAITKYCLENGVDIDQLLAFDSAKFKKIEDEDIKRAVRSLGKEGSMSKFHFIKTAKVEDDEKEE